MHKKSVIITLTFLLALGAFQQLAFAADGAATYKAKCALCHGADGKGQTPVGKSMKLRDLTSADVQKMTDAELTKIIEDGKNKMQPFKGKLTGDEIAAVVKALRAMK